MCNSIANFYRNLIYKLFQISLYYHYNVAKILFQKD